MQIQLFNPNTAGTITTFSAPITRVKDTWAGDWVTKPYLYCIRCEQAVAPAISKAVFNYEYGKQTRQGDTEETTYLPENLTDKFVKVSVIIDAAEVDLWVGIIVEDQRAPFGQTDAAVGNQTFVAYGLEWLLDRAPVRGSVWELDGVTKFADWEPEFNKRSERGSNQVGNCSDNVDSDGVYSFSADGATWTMKDAAKYLLVKFGPSDPAFTLGGQLEMLAGVCPSFPYQGLSVWQALCTIVNPKRGMGMMIRTDGEAVCLHVYSALDTAITEAGLTLPANAEPCNIEIDADTTVESCVVGKSIAQKMHKIIVRGDRVLTCFTLPYSAGYFEDGWVSLDETAYKAGASGLSGYSGWTADEKAGKNDEIRARDYFRDVFSKFIVPHDWNWKNVSGYNVAPTILSDGTIDADTPAEELTAGKTFERSLPLLEGEDYGGYTPPVVTTDPQYRRPLVVIYKDADDETKAGYRFVEKTSDTEENSPGAQVRMLDTQLGVEVLFRPNHIFAKGVYDPDVDPPTRDRNEPIYSFKDNAFYVTVAMRLNQRLTAIRYCDEIGEGSDRELVIDVPGCELHYLVPNTLYDIGANGLLKWTVVGMVLRDDRAILNAIASLAKVWYGRTRRTVSLSIKRLGNYAPAGALLRLVSNVDEDIECNTVVTRVSWNFQTGVTTIETAHVDLDVAGAVIAVDYPDERAMRRALTDHSRRLNELTARTADMTARGSL